MAEPISIKGMSDSEYQAWAWCQLIESVQFRRLYTKWHSEYYGPDSIRYADDWQAAKDELEADLEKHECPDCGASCLDPIEFDDDSEQCLCEKCQATWVILPV